MSGNPVTWFEIYVKDVKRAKAFYEKTLAITLQKLDTPASGVTEMWSFPMGKAIGPHGFIALATDTEGNSIGLHSMK